jgi:hypothetical protein
MNKTLFNQRCFAPVSSTTVPAEHVSMDLHNLSTRLDLGFSQFGFVQVQAVESAFNSLGQMTTTPLIVDSGASCCISPHCEDFATYSTSSVKIKDLSGINKVEGEGLITWHVLDKFGRKCSINLCSYHVPTALVHLISPQCVFQTFRGSHESQDGEQYVLRLMNGSVLEAPYGSANLPILQLSDSC